MSADDPVEESESLSPRARAPVVHNHYTQHKNGNGDQSRVNTMLLACLLAIVGFLGVQIWGFQGRLTRVETSLEIVLQRLPP